MSMMRRSAANDRSAGIARVALGETALGPKDGGGFLAELHTGAAFQGLPTGHLFDD
jgi:hypothetical protein